MSTHKKENSTSKENVETQKKKHMSTEEDYKIFHQSWTLSDETEVRSVEFENGLLTVTLGRIVPDHYRRKDWF